MISGDTARQYCRRLIEDRLASIDSELRNLRDSQLSDTKSSMGDKYETSREMVNLEKNKMLTNRSQTERMLHFLKQVPSQSDTSLVRVGSMFRLESGWFYLSVGLGKVTVEEGHFYAISPASPMGKAIIGKKTDESFELNGRINTVLEIC